MTQGTGLALAFGAVLVGALVATSGLRNRTLSEVVEGVTGPKAQAAASAPSAEAAASPGGGGGGGAPGGGTAGAQKSFGQALARYTGLNPGIVEKWLLAEQPPGSPSKPGSNNWLNVQFTDQGPNGEYYRIAKLSPDAAAKATAQWMAHNQPSILHASTGSPAQQEAAIVNSGWASNKYGGKL
jgi:hypothetical protein